MEVVDGGLSDMYNSSAPLADNRVRTSRRCSFAIRQSLLLLRLLQNLQQLPKVPSGYGFSNVEMIFTVSWY